MLEDAFDESRRTILLTGHLIKLIEQHGDNSGQVRSLLAGHTQDAVFQDIGGLIVEAARLLRTNVDLPDLIEYDRMLQAEEEDTGRLDNFLKEAAIEVQEFDVLIRAIKIKTEQLMKGCFENDEDEEDEEEDPADWWKDT